MGGLEIVLNQRDLRSYPKQVESIRVTELGPRFKSEVWDKSDRALKKERLWQIQEEERECGYLREIPKIQISYKNLQPRHR